MNIKDTTKSLFQRLEQGFHTRYTKFRYAQKINGLLKAVPGRQLSKAQKKEIESYFSSFGYKNVSTKWHEYVLRCSGHYSKYVIPEDLFYTQIEPILNRMEMIPAVVDKGLLSLFMGNVNQPRTIVKNQNGFFFNDKGELISQNQAVEICSSEEEFIVKPTIESGRGNNLLAYKNSSLEFTVNESEIQEIFNSYQKDYIIQEKIIQHKQLEVLNSSTVNTIRILSYLRQGGAVVTSSTLMIGGPGEVADNAGDDCICCGIDQAGCIKHGYDHIGVKFTRNHQGLNIVGHQVPQYDKVIRTAIKNHQNIPYLRMIAWDFTVDNKDNVILLECNAKYQGINGHNLNNGYVFGRFTDEVLIEVKSSHIFT